MLRIVNPADGFLIGEVEEDSAARIAEKTRKARSAQPEWAARRISERIAAIMRMKDYQFSAPRRTVTLHNTNHLVGTDVDVRGGKTGFISKSGYCLATLLRLPQGDQVAVVVLGAKSNPARFWETRHLFNWLASKTPRLLATQTPEQQN